MNDSTSNIASDAKVNAFDLGTKVVDNTLNAAVAVGNGTKHVVLTTSDSVTGFFAGMKYAIKKRSAPREATSRYYSKRGRMEAKRREREAELARKRAHYNYATGNIGSSIIVLGG